jgi:hypothetical protein
MMRHPEGPSGDGPSGPKSNRKAANLGRQPHVLLIDIRC